MSAETSLADPQIPAELRGVEEGVVRILTASFPWLSGAACKCLPPDTTLQVLPNAVSSLVVRLKTRSAITAIPVSCGKRLSGLAASVQHARIRSKVRHGRWVANRPAPARRSRSSPTYGSSRPQRRGARACAASAARSAEPYDDVTEGLAAAAAQAPAAAAGAGAPDRRCGSG